MDSERLGSAASRASRGQPEEYGGVKGHDGDEGLELGL